MNINSLRPAYQFATQYGVKGVCYGPPGQGKTPIFNTAPRPLLLATEPGLLTMRRSNIPTWGGFNAATIKEFFDWFFNSAETRNFDTLGIDSSSQMAEIILSHELGKNKDGRKAYGEMSRTIMGYLNGLYFTKEKHIYLIAKQTLVESGTGKYFAPYHPGQDIPNKIVHLFDLVMRLDTYAIPNVGTHKAFRCLAPPYEMVARDRSEQLAEYEPPNLTQLFAKAMQQ